MNNDLISRSALLKEVRENKELYEKERVYLEGLLLNAPAVSLVEPVCEIKVNITEEEKQKLIEELKKPHKPLILPEPEIAFERAQGDLADEVWKLYEKHQSHLATHVIEFGDELKDLLGKYQKGGAE